MPEQAIYPSFIKKGEIYAEDIEQAIIDYLKKIGFTFDDLQMEYQADDGSYITTKCLKIRFTEPNCLVTKIEGTSVKEAVDYFSRLAADLENERHE